MAAVPEVLVVEDDRDYVANVIGGTLRRIPPSLRSAIGADQIPLHFACWVSAAEEYLSSARENRSLPDVVVLDLGLPSTESEFKKGRANTANGWALLDRITRVYGIPVVILTTNPDELPESTISLEALQHGAADFVNKTELRKDNADFLCRLISVIGKHRESIHRKETEKRLQRLRDFRAKNHWTRIAARVSLDTDEIVDSLDHVSKRLSQQYGLDLERHPDNPIMTGIASVRDAATRVRDVVWESPTGDVDQPELKTLDVGQIVSDQIAATRPCFYWRKVGIEWTPPNPGSFLTMSFNNELTDLVAELVFGSLDSSDDKPITTASQSPCLDRTIRFTIGSTEHDILLTATRTGQRIEPEVMEQLNQGIVEDGEPWQGLLYLKSIGADIGVGVVLESTGARTTIITLHIPVLTGPDHE